MFFVAFSILFCTVLSEHTYAFEYMSAYEGNVSLKGTNHRCTSTAPLYFEEELETPVTFQYTSHNNYYLISFLIHDIGYESSYSNDLTYANLNIVPYISIGGQRYYSSQENIVFRGNDNSAVKLGFEIRGNVSPKLIVDSTTSYWVSTYVIPVITASYHLECYSLTAEEASNYMGQTGINDSIKKGNDLQEKNNELQKEQNETNKGILGKITDFFGSFFENLKGLFVPEDGYFSDFFTRLNDFFAEKLGMLYAPIDMFITFLNTIKDASSNDSGITFPELAWDGTVIIPETKFSFSTITKDFPDLQEKIYFVTDVILVGAVLWLLQVKLKEVLEN